MTIQDLVPFMFSIERMDYLKTEQLKKTQIIPPKKMLMPRSMLPPSLFEKDSFEYIEPRKTIKSIMNKELLENEESLEDIMNNIKSIPTTPLTIPTTPPTIPTTPPTTPPQTLFKTIVKNTIHDKIKSNYFFPKEKDQLFWNFYIMKHGMEEYNSLEYKNIVVEKKIKIEYIELLRTKKQLLKEHKMATLSHIENFLLNEIKIDLKTFLALCVCENLPMIYIHKNTYYELFLDDISYNDDKIPMYTITKFDEPLKYGYKIENKEITKNLYKIDNLNKPLKAMSAYKVDELLDMCHKLGISMSDKKETKQDLYQKIVQRL